MSLPVRDERLGDHACVTCEAVGAHLDKLILDLGEQQSDPAVVEHVLAQVTRWLVLQAVEHFKGTRCRS